MGGVRRFVGLVLGRGLTLLAKKQPPRPRLEEES